MPLVWKKCHFKQLILHQSYFLWKLPCVFPQKFPAVERFPPPISTPTSSTWVTVTSRKNSRRHQVRASSRGSLQGLRCTRVRVGTCSAIGPASEISTCFGFERILSVPICNLQLDFIFAILRKLKHITYPIRIIIWHGGTHLYLPNNSPAVDVTSMDI